MATATVASVTKQLAAAKAKLTADQAKQQASQPGAQRTAAVNAVKADQQLVASLQRQLNSLNAITRAGAAVGTSPATSTVGGTVASIDNSGVPTAVGATSSTVPALSTDASSFDQSSGTNATGQFYGSPAYQGAGTTIDPNAQADLAAAAAADQSTNAASTPAATNGLSTKFKWIAAAALIGGGVFLYVRSKKSTKKSPKAKT